MENVILLIFIGIALLIAAFFKPYVGLLIYMGFLYLRPADVYPALAPYHVTRIVAIVTIVGFLLQSKGGYIWAPQNRLVIGFLGVIVLSFFGGGWIPACLVRLEQMGKNVINYFLIINLIDSKKRLKGFVWTLMIFSAILAFNTVQEYRDLGAEVASRLRIGAFSGGYFGGAGDFAVMMNVMVPFGFFLMWGERAFVLKLLSLSFMALYIAGMVCTGARGGGVVTFAAVIACLMYLGLRSPRPIRKLSSLIMAAAMVLGIIFLAPSQFKSRAETIANYKQETTAWRRIEYWKLGAKMFLDHPITGVGAGNYPLNYKKYGGWERIWRVSHNMFVDATAELGIIGISVLLYLLYLTFRDHWEIQKLFVARGDDKSWLYYVSQASMVSLIAYCVGGMFQSIFYYPMLYILIAMAVATKQIITKETSQQS